MVVVFLNKYYGQYQMLGDIMRKKMMIFTLVDTLVWNAYLKTADKLMYSLTPSE